MKIPYRIYVYASARRDDSIPKYYCCDKLKENSSRLEVTNHLHVNMINKEYCGMLEDVKFCPFCNEKFELEFTGLRTDNIYTDHVEIIEKK